jgi:hypothetical protein
MASKQENIIVFFDTVGRTIIGEKVTESETKISIKNPVIVHIVPNPQTGQMALQLFPAFFKEFQADKNEDTTWHYWKSQIVLSDTIKLDFRLYSQYENMFSNLVLPNNNIVTPGQAQANPAGEIVKLFD